MMIRPIGRFDHASVDRSIGRATSLEIDLRSCDFITPFGLVLLGVALADARSRNAEVVVSLDATSAVARYAARMGVGGLARSAGATGDAFPNVAHRPAQDRFLELTALTSTGYNIVEDVCRIMLARSADWGIDTRMQQRLYNVVFELGLNVEQHAGVDGLATIQHYPQANKVEFAIGDHGRGVKRSLQKAGYQLSSDQLAIRAAVETGATGSGEPGKGKGLPGLRQTICGPLLRGRLVVFSGDGCVTYRPGQEPILTNLPTPLPGTLVTGWFATTGGTTPDANAD
jgi:hypothetical protein